MTTRSLVLRGATVLTMDGAAANDAAARAAGDPDRPDAAGRRVDAVGVADGRIVAVGPAEDVAAAAGSGATVVDLRGMAVLPAFAEPHGHPLWEGVERGWPALPTGPDLRAGMRALASHAARLPPDDWLVVRYDQTGWREGRHPDRGELDRAVPDRPVVLDHVSGHAVVANSLALALAGITAGAGDRPGAAVARDLHGEPTGLVLGPGAWSWIAAAMPGPAAGELAAAIARVGAAVAAHGIAAIADADVGGAFGLAAELEAWGAAVGAGLFAPRLSLLPGLVRLAPEPDRDPPGPAEVADSLPAVARGQVRLDRAKLFADGALTTRSAWLAEPYADEPAATGEPAHDPAVLAERVRRAAGAGWSVATHAIGDAAIAATIDAYVAAGTGLPDGRRHRVDHAMVLSDGLIGRLAAAGIPVVMQPEFVTWAGDTYRHRLGPRRAGHLNRYASVLAAGIRLAFSSDRPVVGGAPLDGVRAALRHAGPSGAPLAPGERPSVAEALRAWTAGAAAAMDEADAGVIAPGRRGDLVVLSADPTAIAAEAWATGEDGVRVVATIVGGRVVAGDLPGVDAARAGAPA